MYLPENKTVAGLLRKQIKKDYEIFIMNKVRIEKARALEKWGLRADYDGTLRVVDKMNFEATLKKHHGNSSSEEVE